MKKGKVVIGIIIILIIVIIAGVFIYLNKQSKEPLFKYSYENNTIENNKSGYTIYFNGTIEEYDDYADQDKLKKEKLTKDEIKKLKQLANEVEDEYQEYDTEILGAGLGKSLDEVYSRRLKKWITLSKMEDDGSGGGNLSEKGEEILNLTGDLYKKYIESTDENTNENITEETTEE